jgi:hypothetical protein
MPCVLFEFLNAHPFEKVIQADLLAPVDPLAGGVDFAAGLDGRDNHGRRHVNFVCLFDDSFQYGPNVAFAFVGPKPTAWA